MLLSLLRLFEHVYKQAPDEVDLKLLTSIVNTIQPECDRYSPQKQDTAWDEAWNPNVKVPVSALHNVWTSMQNFGLCRVQKCLTADALPMHSSSYAALPITVHNCDMF